MLKLASWPTGSCHGSPARGLHMLHFHFAVFCCLLKQHAHVPSIAACCCRGCCCRSSQSRCPTGRRCSSRSSSALGACMRALQQMPGSQCWSRQGAAAALARATSRSSLRALRTMSAHLTSTEPRVWKRLSLLFCLNLSSACTV